MLSGGGRITPPDLTASNNTNLIGQRWSHKKEVAIKC